MNMRKPTTPQSGYTGENWPALSSPERAVHERPGAWLEWWYQLTAPMTPSPKASLAQQEVARRGRLTSTILLLLLIIALAVLLLSLFGPFRFLLPIMLGSLLVTIIALLLNRKGMITLAGLLLVLSIMIGYAIGLLRTPGGLGVNNVATFDLLVESEVIAVSLLPASSIFLVALGNCLFIWADLTFQPHTTELNHIIATGGYVGLLLRPITLQIVVAVVAFLWVQSALRAMIRANRAEEIATLQHAITEQKRQLDMGIQLILQTHVQVANGDLTVRAPLPRENVLWQIGLSLNNLLARLQRLNQAEQQLYSARMENARLAEALRKQSAEAGYQLRQARMENIRLTEALHRRSKQ